MEDYAAKMALKTDAALREYVTGHAQYREDAVLAALDELRRRGQPAPEDAELRPLLEAAVREQQATAAAQTSAEAEVPDEDLPRLYSPAGIIVVSATLSVVAGAILLAMNMYRLGRGSAILRLFGVVAAYLVARAFLVKWLFAQHFLSLSLAFLIDIPLILSYIWWFWPRYIGTYKFQPRNWALPLGGCLLLLMGLTYLVMSNPETAKKMQQQLEQIQRSR